MKTTLKTPDVTVAQVVAIAGALLTVLVAAGLDISKALQDSIISLVTVLAPVLLISDAAIRHGRSRALLNQPKGEIADNPDDDDTGLLPGRGA